MKRIKMSAFFRLAYQSNTSHKEQKSFIHSLFKVSGEETFLMHGNMLHGTIQMGVLRFKVLNLINPTVQWHILTPSESTLLSRIFIDSLTGFWISVVHSRIPMFPFMKESVSVHHPII